MSWKITYGEDSKRDKMEVVRWLLKYLLPVIMILLLWGFAMMFALGIWGANPNSTKPQDIPTRTVEYDRVGGTVSPTNYTVYWEDEVFFREGWVVEIIQARLPGGEYRVGWAIYAKDKPVLLDIETPVPPIPLEYELVNRDGMFEVQIQDRGGAVWFSGRYQHDGNAGVVYRVYKSLEIYEDKED
jgi:hypothetical protein